MDASALSHQAFARRGDELFERVVRPKLDPDADASAFVAIDVETGDYAVHPRELDAVDALTARRPEARGRIWLRRVGSPIAHRLGGGFRRAGSAS